MEWKKRFFALGVHILFSIFLLVIALLLVFILWYPAPLAKAMGVTQIFWLILAIDLILGPLLTFTVFNPQKKELKRDLLVIILIQISAYIYGLHTVAYGRPVWKVFVVDDIELVRAIDIYINPAAKIDIAYQSSILKKPRWVSAVYSQSPIVAQQQKQAEIFEGISLARRPETYQPLSVRSEQIKKKLKNMSELSKFNSSKKVEKILKKYKDKSIVGFLPVKGFQVDMTVLINTDMQPVAIVDLRPWD